MRPDTILKQSDLDQFRGGTENYHRHAMGELIYTDGVKFVAEKAQAHWLIDAIASYLPQIEQDEELKSFSIWLLEVEGKKAKLTCRTDTEQPPAIEQYIQYTDYLSHSEVSPLKLYQQGNVLILPQEY